MMLHYADEQATFRCICELMKNSNYFLAPSEMEIIAACFVLKDLAYRYAVSSTRYIRERLSVEKVHFYQVYCVC